MGFERNAQAPKGRSKRAGRGTGALARLLGVVVGGLLLGCSRQTQFQYPNLAPVRQEGDTAPFVPAPREQEAIVVWEGFDTSFFAPISRALAMRPRGRARNVNSMDEVPNSSWFRNRIGQGGYSSAEVARGACLEPPLDPRRTWNIVAGKGGGANPGFIIEDLRGRRFLLKFGGTLQGPRAIAASTIGSRAFHAAGYFAPCNRVVYVQRENLRIAPEATVKGAQGKERPLTEQDLAQTFEKGLRLRDGRYVAVSSRFVEGKPLGPWRYEGTRDDDPNDRISHEDRRELRGMRLLAAWIGHYDSRDGNTLSAWIEGRGGGHVRHYVIDFGESLGSLWTPPQFARSVGHAAYVDFTQILFDWFSLGVKRRPYRLARFGPSGRIFGYFDVAGFEPEEFATGFPNPAFNAMTEADAAWMARILAHFDEASVRRLVATADLRDPFLERELVRILMGRRNKILDRYLTTLSPLTHPRIAHEKNGSLLCLTDLLLESGRVSLRDRSYRVMLLSEGERRAVSTVFRKETHEICGVLPAAPDVSAQKARYLQMDVFAKTQKRREQPPASVFLYSWARRQQIVALQRHSASSML